MVWEGEVGWGGVADRRASGAAAGSAAAGDGEMAAAASGGGTAAGGEGAAGDAATERAAMEAAEALSDAETEAGDDEGRPERLRLQYGSADPHCTGGSDRAPRASRAPPFAVHAHMPADASELEVRPMPAACQAPRTDPLPPPPPPPAPPLVTRREQVVPAATLRLVSWWRRRLRRCMRAAAHGDAGLARRLRPEDLFLDHASHSVAATAAWDWDLEPLDRGLPAVAMQPSGRGGLEPATSVRLREWLRDAVGFPDQAIVSEVANGVADDSQCRRGTLLCAPHAGGLAHHAVAEAKLAASVAAGYASAPHALPCWPLRTCPYSVVDESVRAGKPKFRLTTDLSWPHAGVMAAGGRPVDSVNGGMDRAAWPANRLVRVREFAEAAGILQGASGQRRTRLWSLDCEAFYRAVGRQRAELWRNGVWCLGGASLDGRCCFGDASAATKCARISNYLVFQIRAALSAFDAAHPTRDPAWRTWQATRRAAGVEADLAWVAMYIDDAVAASADDAVFDAAGRAVCDASGEQRRRAACHFEIARATIERYGWLSSPGKEQPPALEVDALGVRVDLRTSRLYLSQAKCQRYGAHVRQVLREQQCERASYERLLGRLQFAAQCFPYGRQHLHACWRVMRASFRLQRGRVQISQAAQRELRWWASFLEAGAGEGVPLAAVRMPPVGPACAAVYADASTSGGFMAWTVRDGVLLYAQDVWSADEQAQLGIAEMELLASTFGLVAFADHLPRCVVSYTDNTVAQAAMRAAAVRAAPMQHLVAVRTRWLLERGVAESSRRITTTANLWADWGSRGRLDRVLEQAAQLQLQTQRCHVPCGWREVLTWPSRQPSLV